MYITRWTSPGIVDPKISFPFEEALRWITACPNLRVLCFRSLRRLAFGPTNWFGVELAPYRVPSDIRLPESLQSYELINFRLKDRLWERLWDILPPPRKLTLAPSEWADKLSRVTRMDHREQLEALDLGVGIFDEEEVEEESSRCIAHLPTYFPNLKRLKLPITFLRATFQGPWRSLSELEVDLLDGDADLSALETILRQQQCPNLHKLVIASPSDDPRFEVCATQLHDICSEHHIEFLSRSSTAEEVDQHVWVPYYPASD
jgi:hypothetical protein